jgi:hypothetical protein
VRSKYGDVFERETIERWLTDHGPSCPVRKHSSVSLNADGARNAHSPQAVTMQGRLLCS